MQRASLPLVRKRAPRCMIAHPPGLLRAQYVCLLCIYNWSRRLTTRLQDQIVDAILSSHSAAYMLLIRVNWRYACCNFNAGNIERGALCHSCPSVSPWHGWRVYRTRCTWYVVYSFCAPRVASDCDGCKVPACALHREGICQSIQPLLEG